MKKEKDLLSKRELLEIFLHHRVNSPYPGDWESIFKGTGYEFWSLRELEPTDPFRNIDWKAKAKTGKYYVREYLAESYYNLMILYDISRSVALGEKELLQAKIAISLAYTAIVSNNGCGLIMFAEDVIQYIPPRMGREQFMEIFYTIANAEPVACRKTDLNHALTKLVNEIPESLTFILSDFMFPVECAYNFQRTIHGTSKHEVKAIQVLEKYEKELPPNSQGLIALSDYENETKVFLDLSKWKDYNKKMEAQLAETRARLNKAGIDLLLITPGEDYCIKINDFMRGAHWT